MKKYFLLASFFGFIINTALTQSAPRQIRVIVIGAHPDDCDFGAGGTAALFSAMGYAVKFVSVTNGDAGHQLQGGGILARRRADEAREAGKRLGVAYEVLNNQDGELVPSLEVRLQVIRKIREWNADVVITHRPNDYHPDHRYTGVLVQDAAYMVAVPNIAADMAPLKKQPLFLYMQDDFQRPNPFRPDIAIDITSINGKKMHGLDAHVSQFYEWMPWIDGYSDKVPAKIEDHEKWLTQMWSTKVTPRVLAALEKWYGRDKASQAKYAEAFEICEYGAQPTEEEIRMLFPMIGSGVGKSTSGHADGEGILMVKHTNDFNFTGNGSAPNWAKTSWLTLPQRNKSDITFQTKVKLLYSDSGIYCLYNCEDKKITATLKGDFLDLYNEDVVEAFFQTDENQPLYFEYELSPLNYELPILVPNNKGNFYGWLPWHYEGARKTRHATHVFKNGGVVSAWTAEFFIPYSLLKPMTNVPPRKGTRWKANFYRIDYDKGESNWQWQEVLEEDFHDYERFGVIVFD